MTEGGDVEDAEVDEEVVELDEVGPAVEEDELELGVGPELSALIRSEARSAWRLASLKQRGSMR